MADLVRTRVPKRAYPGPGRAAGAKPRGASSPAINPARSYSRRPPLGVPHPSGTLLPAGRPVTTRTPRHRMAPA